MNITEIYNSIDGYIEKMNKGSIDVATAMSNINRHIAAINNGNVNVDRAIVDGISIQNYAREVFRNYEPGKTEKSGIEDIGRGIKGLIAAAQIKLLCIFAGQHSPVDKEKIDYGTDISTLSITQGLVKLAVPIIITGSLATRYIFYRVMGC